MSVRRALRACVLGVVAAAAATPAGARTGTGDPAEVFRDRPVNPDNAIDLVLHGQLRLRSQVGLGLDLGRGASPTSGRPLYGKRVQLGQDARVRLTPSLFVGDDVRLFLDVDLLAASLGPAAVGIPWAARSDDDRAFALQPLDVRALGVDWLLPIGVLSLGRMPAHFGLGIGANDGADLDDDGGDRADRLAFVAPFSGALVAAALDVGPGPSPSAFGPSTRALVVGEQAVSVGAMRWHAPWEVELHRRADRPLLDGGGALAFEWSSAENAAPWVTLDWTRAPGAVRRDAHLTVVDLWVRGVWGRFRVEGEGLLSDLAIDNPSPWPGVMVRRTIRGNPAAFALVGEARLLDAAAGAPPDALVLQLETGAASADPAAGFPDVTPTAFTGAQPGDVFGPQVDLKRGGDERFDAARIHPLHRIDLILWRTLLGGVSEAAYARAQLAGSPTPWLRLDGALIYSHAIVADSAPGGVAPLGIELDVGAEATLGDSSVRLDAGSLCPLGGLGARGGDAPALAHLVLVRVGHAL